MAALAILLSSMAPVLAQVRASSTDNGWVEVCTAQGFQWVQMQDTPAPSKAPAYLLGECCHCVLHVLGLALPPDAHGRDFRLPQSQAHPLASPPAPHSQRFWVRAHSRAPPRTA